MSYFSRFECNRMGVLLVRHVKCDRGDLKLRERLGVKARERRILARYTALLVSQLPYNFLQKRSPRSISITVWESERVIPRLFVHLW